MKKLVFTIICFLSVIFGITNVEALSKPTYYLTDSDYSSLTSKYPNYSYAVFYNVNDTNYYAFVSAVTTNSFYNYRNNNITLGTYDNSTFNYFSNYNKTRYAYQFNYNSLSNSIAYNTLFLDKTNHTWLETWRYDINLDMNSNYYFIAYILGDNLSFNNNQVFIDNDNTTILYKSGWNISYYDTIMNYFDITGSFSYITTPDSVYGSNTNFSSDDYEFNTLTEDKLYINHHMYSSDDLSIDTSMIGSHFHYDNYGDFYDNNYELGFILTYKYLLVDDEPTILVNAKTKTGSYSCDIEPVMIQNYNSNEIAYQSYINCPSVAFTSDSDEMLDIYVKGSYDFSIYNIYPTYFTNYLFLEDKANIGISQILKKVTDTVPIPLPDEGGDSEPEQNTNDLITDINNSINSGALPDNLDNLVDFAGYLPPGPVDSILTIPLTFMNNYYSVFTSSSCNAINIPFPYLNDKYFQLPCGNTLINNMGFLNWWETIGAFFGGWCLYRYLINLYKWVDETLTLRENNWPDWGGA